MILCQRNKKAYDAIDKIDMMKEAILARAFCGELGTNNPEEESAVELLKEVLKEKNKILVNWLFTTGVFINGGFF